MAKATRGSNYKLSRKAIKKYQEKEAKILAGREKNRQQHQKGI
jgi:hypothetical protein